MILKKLLLGLLWFSSVSSLAQQKPVYLDEAKPVEDRIEDILHRLTTEEKISLIHAQSKFSSPGIARLGLPEIWTTDGPHGIRPEVLWDEWNQAGWTNDSCVAFPALTCLAATWNTDMAFLYGKSIGEEAKYRKKDILLGPGVNIYRTPLNGRNFEYMGEDPYLASRMAAPYVKGVQSNGVAACIKHFALNNHEINRHNTNVEVDERALHEIYLPAFKAAVQEGGAWAIMGAYNLYRNQHACHNKYLLNDILKNEWGFDGVVISDWGGTHNTFEAITNGLDMEFGTWTNGLTQGPANAYNNYYMASPYLKLIREGKFDEKELNDKVRRVLRLMFRTTLNSQRPTGSMRSEAHYNAARTIAEEGIVLLKNKNNILPIDLAHTPKIAVIGENAIKMMTVGGGSSSLKVQHECLPLEGIRKRVRTNAQVVYARGYIGDTSDEYNNVVTGKNIKDSRSSTELIKEAVKIASQADYVIFVGGLNKSPGQDCEDSDRTGLELPYNQDIVIDSISKVNKNLIIVNISGNAVAMPWADKAAGIIQAWYLGSEAGNAIASVLMGDTNPSGKLPFTFPAKLEDVPAHSLGGYVNERKKDIVNVEYKEGIYVGYRWTDKHKNTKPLFPFGHGLSYTSFVYSKPVADSKVMSASGKLTISVKIKNTGKRTGKEIVQLYISDRKSSLPRPLKELKDFRKVELLPGEEKNIDFIITKEKLCFFNDTKHEWTAEPGTFDVLIGASSTDIRGKVSFEMIEDVVNNSFVFASRQIKYAFTQIDSLRNFQTKNNKKLISPRTFEKNGTLRMVPSSDWTSGFFPGELWYMYEYTSDDYWKKKAMKFTAPLENQKYNAGTHDMGFKMFCSFGNGYRLTHDETYKNILLKSASTLIKRYKPNVGCIRSWDHGRNKWQCPVIIDNMMNLELLYWAFKETGDSIYYNIATNHARTTMKNHFRKDYSSYHVIDYDTITGKVLHKHTHQGYNHESAWARGQAWGLYGYTMCYRETKLPEFLLQAKNIANYIFTHPSMPDDLIAFWDFNAPDIPDEPRDVSAASVMACALYELSMYIPEQSCWYKRLADTIVEKLYKKYRARLNGDCGFLLLHSTGARNFERDVPLVYADYYFLEALLKKQKLENEQTALLQ